MCEEFPDDRFSFLAVFNRKISILRSSNPEPWLHYNNFSAKPFGFVNTLMEQRRMNADPVPGTLPTSANGTPSEPTAPASGASVIVRVPVVFLHGHPRHAMTEITTPITIPVQINVRPMIHH